MTRTTRALRSLPTAIAMTAAIAFSATAGEPTAIATSGWTAQDDQEFVTHYRAAFQASQGRQPSADLLRNSLNCMRRAYDRQATQGFNSNLALDYATTACQQYLRFLGTDSYEDTGRAHR